MPLAFLKMHGAGNRIVVVDQRAQDGPPPTPEQLRRLGDEATGPGFDERGDRVRSLATDGETFGHHHRFGEMALAAALERAGKSFDDVTSCLDFGCGYGSLTEILTIRGAGTESVFSEDVPLTVDMEGREVFRNAVTRMGEGALVAIENAGLELDDVESVLEEGRRAVRPGHREDAEK